MKTPDEMICPVCKQDYDNCQHNFDEAIEASGDEAETELLKFMLERLSNTPLMREVQKGDQVVQINETQRIFWTIKFIQDIAEERGLSI